MGLAFYSVKLLYSLHLQVTPPKSISYSNTLHLGIITLAFTFKERGLPPLMFISKVSSNSLS